MPSLQTLSPFIFPIIFISFIAARFVRFRRTKAQLPKYLKDGAIIIDVRSPEEYSKSSRPGSINIPLHEIKKRLEEVDKNQTVILCCGSGTRSGMAAGILKRNGFKSVVNAGAWTNTLST